MNINTENVSQLTNVGKVYELKVENINVEMHYSKNDKSIEECMLNILKQKIGML